MATKPYTLPNGRTINISEDKITYPIEQVQKQSRDWQRKYYDYLYNDRGAGWFWAGLDHLNPQNDINYVSKEQQEKIKSGNTDMTYNGGDLQEIVVTPNGVRESNTPTNIAVETDWTPEDRESVKGATIHYNPYKASYLDYAWRNGGDYEGKQLSPSPYANLGNEVALAVGTPIAALNPVTGALAGAVWDGAAAAGKAALNWGSRQLGKLATRQVAQAAGQQAAQTVASPSTNYMAFLNNNFGQMVPRYLQNGTIALETAVPAELTEAMATTAFLSPMLANYWTADTTGDGNFSYQKEQESDKTDKTDKTDKPDETTPKEDPKTKLSVTERAKALVQKGKDKWKKMHPINKAATLGLVVGAGHLGADTYKGLTNNPQTNPVQNGTQQAIPVLSEEQYDVDTLQYVPQDLAGYQGGYEEWDPYESLY